ncbi:hypothetical protein [Hymenobacter sediminicola]|uniref:Gliding motility protein GldL n=1 Tax=Hymenobacter sediminicola TaxID=2761579 RepID=A0A7G7W4I4_9BACT|nr:hypothetical protein [Hymenobacter sediminicola]QNH61277.1 hypothetical protein H4317_14040 [Hymenobacter sediminicola]
MKLTYRLLIMLLLLGMVLVLLAAFFRSQRYPGGDGLLLTGLALQLLAAVLVFWKFAGRLRKRQ